MESHSQAGRLAPATVTGIQEFPQFNTAQATVGFADGRLGNAGFSHYNDGRWVLTSVGFASGGAWTGIDVEVGR